MQTNPYANPQYVKVSELRPSVDPRVNIVFIILEKGPVTKASETSAPVATALVADHTGSVHFQFWGNECDVFQPGDICKVTNGIFAFMKAELVLRKGRKGTVEKTGEFAMVFSEIPNMSRLQWVHDPTDSKQWIPVSYPSRTPHLDYPSAPTPMRTSH